MRTLSRLHALNRAFRSGPVRDLLLTVARRDADDGHLERLAAKVDREAMVAACHRHGVVSVVHERLRTVEGIDREFLESMERVRIAAQIRCLELEHTQAVVGKALDVPWLAVKGDVLAQWHENPGLRDFNDLDVLVRPRDFRRALESLAAFGIVPVGSNWRGFSTYEVAEVPLAFGRSVIDLHWHLVGMGESRRHIRLPTDELFERAVPVRSGRTDALTLDSTDTLIHLCVNAGLDGARRLRGLIDVDAVVRTNRIDFDDFATRARQARAGRLAAPLLQRSQTLLGTPLPSGLLAELSPGGGWLFANRVVDRAGAFGRRVDSGILPGLLLASGRESGVATAIAFGRSLSRSVVAEMGRPALTQPGGALDWQRQSPDGSGDVARDEYLGWVERQ